MKLIPKAIIGSMILMTAQLAFANAQQTLQERLDKVASYSAQFTQRVINTQGQLLQNGKGTFMVKRPALFRLDTTSPEESQLISDGKTLWYYNPFVQQVTAKNLAQSVENTPFVLLTDNNSKNWKEYNVTQVSNTFKLTPKSANSALKYFTIYIDKNGLIRNFSSTDKDGQVNAYNLTNLSTKPLANKLFEFKVPAGVELDDQRN